MTRITGACRCGRVTYSIEGEATRIGICHCTDCRRESGSAFTFFGVWPASSFSTSGQTEVHEGRRFCPTCGSRMFSYNDNEAEVKLGTLRDAPTALVPTYELWVKRREHWLSPINDAIQYTEDKIV